MKITQDVCELAATHGMADDEAMRVGLHAKAAELCQAGGQLYAKPNV
jgi:phosphomethylpyrimidine synthase